MARQRKQYLLRIPQDLYDIYETWAGDEFRSVNAQIEATLVDAARRANRLKRPTPATGEDRHREDRHREDRDTAPAKPSSRSA